jgi:hypothetical protein
MALYFQAHFFKFLFLPHFLWIWFFSFRFFLVNFLYFFRCNCGPGVRCSRGTSWPGHLLVSVAGAFCRPIHDIKIKSIAAGRLASGNENAGGRRVKWTRTPITAKTSARRINPGASVILTTGGVGGQNEGRPLLRLPRIKTSPQTEVSKWTRSLKIYS